MALNINRYGLRTQYLTMILVPAPAVQYKQSKATESREILECHDIAWDLKSYSCICQQLAISTMITLKAIWYHYYIQNVSSDNNNYTLGPKLWNQPWILKQESRSATCDPFCHFILSRITLSPIWLTSHFY